MINAVTTVWATCAGQDVSGGCHASEIEELDLVHQSLDYEKWLQEEGWLVIGDMAYCPSCRFELHD